MIDSPLWDLMLSTNDCLSNLDRSNGDCRAEDFRMNFNRVQAWADTVGSATTRDALDQLDELLSLSRVDWKSLSEQTRINFENEAQARAWLGQWWDLLVGTLD